MIKTNWQLWGPKHSDIHYTLSQGRVCTMRRKIKLLSDYERWVEKRKLAKQMETKYVRNSSYCKQKESRFLGGSAKQYFKSQSVTVRIGDRQYMLFLEFLHLCSRWPFSDYFRRRRSKESRYLWLEIELGGEKFKEMKGNQFFCWFV